MTTVPANAFADRLAPILGIRQTKARYCIARLKKAGILPIGTYGAGRRLSTINLEEAVAALLGFLASPIAEYVSEAAAEVMALESPQAGTMAADTVELIARWLETGNEQILPAIEVRYGKRFSGALSTATQRTVYGLEQPDDFTRMATLPREAAAHIFSIFDKPQKQRSTPLLAAE